MKRHVLVIAIAVGACGRGTSDATARAGLPFTVEGTVQVNGQVRTVKSCQVPGRGLQNRVVLTLDDGSVVTMPLHDGRTSLTLPGKPAIELASCDKVSMEGSGTESYFKGSLGRVCKGDGAALDVAVKLTCGQAPPSNRVDGK